MMNIVHQPQEHLRSFVRTGFVTISAVQMNMILRFATYDHQRRVDKRHIAVLSDLMSRDQWEPKDKIDFADFNGRLILVNGYHRAHAQVATGRFIEWTIVVHSCASEDDLRALYYKFDTNTRTRTPNQILNGVGFSEEHGLSKTMGAALFRAAPIIAAGMRMAHGGSAENVLTQRVMDRRLSAAAEYAPAAAVLDVLFKDVPFAIKPKIFVAGFMAVALATVRYQEAAGAEFWSGFSRNDGLRRGDPRHTLLNDLMTRSKRHTLMAQSMIVPAVAWNAYFRNRPLSQIKVTETTRFELLGTPFTIAARQ